jgi:uncharacterized protein YkwD
MLTRRILLISLAAAPPILAADPPLRQTLPEIERRTFDAINGQRTMSQLDPLVWDDVLCLTARHHSRRMLEADFFGHDDPKFGDLQARLDAAGVAWWMCGENVFREKHHPDPVAIALVDWMHSEGHRRNILSPDYTNSAIGVAMGPDGMVTMTQQFLKPVPEGMIRRRKP